MDLNADEDVVLITSERERSESILEVSKAMRVERFLLQLSLPNDTDFRYLEGDGDRLEGGYIAVLKDTVQHQACLPRSTIGIHLT